MSEYAPADPSATPLKDYLTANEVAALTGHTVKTLAQYRTYRGRGRIYGPDFVKHGYHVLYTRASVEAYLAASREV